MAEEPKRVEVVEVKLNRTERDANFGSAARPVVDSCFVTAALERMVD
jgi:hypothetical protein